MSFDNRPSAMESGGGTSDIQSQNAVTLCKSGCGFFGNASFEGMCSKCYKEEQVRRKTASESSEQKPTETVMDCDNVENKSTNVSSSSSASASASQTAAFNPPDSDATSSNDSADSQTESSSQNPDVCPSVDTDSGLRTVASSDSSLAASNSDASFEGIVSDSSQDEKSGNKKKNRCQSCKKRVGLTGFECRCGGLFCSVHRYSDKHECNFDYKELAQGQIRKNNPVVVGEKIQKL